MMRVEGITPYDGPFEYRDIVNFLWEAWSITLNGSGIAALKYCHEH